jgi:hypothetical protein
VRLARPRSFSIRFGALRLCASALKNSFVFSGVFALWAFFFTHAAFAQEDSAQQLAARLGSEFPEENSAIHGVIHIRSGDLHTNIPMVCKVEVNDGSWRSIYETDFEHLFVVHTTNGPNQYLQSKVGGPTNVLADPNTSFAGSDFSAADLGLDFLHWPSQTKLKGEMRLGQPCDVLESSKPALPAGSPGAVIRVRAYIDKQSGGIIEAEGFDSTGRLVKEFSLHGSFFRKVNGQWRLEKMEMTDKLKHSQTIFQFDMSN